MKKLLIAVIWLLWSYGAWSQQRISGTVRDAATGELVIGCTLQQSSSQAGAITNQYGFFSLVIAGPKVRLRVSHIGYRPDTLSLTLLRDTLLTIYLSSQTLEEVTVRESRQIYAPPGMLHLPVSRLKAVPMLLGEQDIFKALATTPGISTGQEGSAGLYVRGGSPDQNLILLDEAPVYNVSHLFGFLSVFNPDALKNVEVYKAGFPARYGGRLSSVIDVTMRDGNSQNTQGEWGIGLINSRFLFEGPLKKNKTSFLFSARTTNLGILMLPQRLIVEAGKDQMYSTYWLYDLNLKVNHRFDDKNQLFISMYSGYDFYQGEQRDRDYRERLQLNWGNITSTMRYTRIFSSRLFGKAVFTYSKFRYNFNTYNKIPIQQNQKNEETSEQSSSYLRDWSWKATIEYALQKNCLLKSGVELITHLYNPSLNQQKIEGVLHTTQTNPIRANEYAIFGELEYQPISWLFFNVGLRTTLFQLTDQTYRSFEPRFNANIVFKKDWSIKIGQSQMQQYLHLLTNNGIGFSNDIWVPATSLVPPQRSYQSAIEIVKHWPKLGIEWSVGGYFKTMRDIIDYRQGADLVGNYSQDWQKLIELNGIGRAYGGEMFINKKQGKLTGWISYTLAWSQRQFANINQGNWYPFKYDRRHHFATTLNYNLSTKWTFSSNWTYQTGHAVTLPKAAMTDVYGKIIYIYGGRNQFRMPNYHRLDLAFTKTYLRKNQKQASWSFGVYNAYNRQNPYLLDLKTLVRQGNTPQSVVPDRIEIRQLSLIPVLPYISHSRKF
ncbi:MAG: TonB-dependent receptor plug domain-containing protein [Runella sp.]